MILEKINEIIDKIPITLIVVCYFGYLGYDYYTYQNDSTSVLIAKKNQIVAAKESETKLEIRLQQAQEFVKTLDKKKEELRRLAQDLQEAKTTLSENLDIPIFMKMVVTEAKKSGLIVLGLDPVGSTAKEYYSEQVFKMTYHGFFAQLASFLDRLANVNQIVRVETFDIKPNSQRKGKFVPIDGVVEIKTYKYLGSKADSLASSGESSNSQIVKNGSKVSGGGSNGNGSNLRGSGASGNSSGKGL